MPNTRRLTAQLLAPELEFVTSRSSGPGGQNVNKVSTKVTVRFQVTTSQILTDEEKQLLQEKLATRLTTEGTLLVASQDKRSQLQNKAVALAKLERILAKAQHKKKPRKATKPTKASVQNRLDKKKQQSEKKQWRRGL